MLREARVILPIANNNGVALDDIHHALKVALCQTFGGYTAHQTEGGWISPTGKLYQEPGIAYDVAVADNAKARINLHRIAARFADLAEQECVYLRHADGTVTFIQPGTITVAA